MTRAEFDRYCRTFKAVENVEQWGGASVWKLGGKIFAICSTWGAGSHPKISFKCSDLAFSILREQPGIIPAPYLARAKWVQLEAADAMRDRDIKDYIAAAYVIIMARLTKAQRQELGLSQAAP
ncbi:MAG: MmcQ/YjbR family DNA-binding protein [Proteobacteria bacterium]|nr:MmcQ/YjbR family DNA-binding protein [Pseudomonadota bacterium]